MRVECLLERFDRERVAKSSDPVLNRIAGWVSDEQFLEIAGLDGPARRRVAYDLLKLEQSQNDVHIAETFSQPKDSSYAKSYGPDTWIDLRHVMQLRTLSAYVNNCEPNDQCSLSDRRCAEHSWTCNP